MSEASEDDHNQRKKRKLTNSSENISPHEHSDSQLDSHQNPSVSLLQHASSLFENISKVEPLIVQEELEEDYVHVENEIVSPEFYGEPVPDDEDNDNVFELHAGLPKRKTEVPKDDEIPIVEGKLELDFYNADLNVKLNKTNKWLITPDNSTGFALMMSEIRTNYGVVVGRATSRIAFQGSIKSYLPIKHLPFEELNPYICQIGWSTMKYSNCDQVKVYGYCSTGKKFVGGDFQAFGEGFGLNDVITTILDVEKMEIVYYKNEQCLGKLFSGKELFEVGDVVFPYFSTKNCELLANFGVEEPKNDGENIWNLPKEESDNGTIFIGDLNISSCFQPSPRPPLSKSDCTVAFMIGLPGVGKTTWIKNYLKQHPTERWIHLNSENLLEKMNLDGMSRRKLIGHSFRNDMILGLIAKTMNKCLTMACYRRNNYFVDQTNCFQDLRRKRLELFEGFHRRCLIIMPDEAEIEARQMKSIKNDCFGEKMPAETMLMFKGMISLPNMDEEPVEEIEIIEPELGKIDQAVEQVKKYNLEGQPWLRKYSKKKSTQSFFSDNNPQNKPIVPTTLIRSLPEFDPTIPPPQIMFHQ